MGFLADSLQEKATVVIIIVVSVEITIVIVTFQVRTRGLWCILSLWRDRSLCLPYFTTLSQSCDTVIH